MKIIASQKDLLEAGGDIHVNDDANVDDDNAHVELHLHLEVQKNYLGFKH